MFAWVALGVADCGYEYQHCGFWFLWPRIRWRGESAFNAATHRNNWNQQRVNKFTSGFHSPVRVTELGSEEISVFRNRLARQTYNVLFVDSGKQQNRCETQWTYGEETQQQKAHELHSVSPKPRWKNPVLNFPDHRRTLPCVVCHVPVTRCHVTFTLESNTATGSIDFCMNKSPVHWHVPVAVISQNLEDLLRLGFSDQFGVEKLNWSRD